MVIGERIRKARVAHGLNQQKLGDLLEVSKVSICGYEKGNRTPTMENFLKLVEILDCDPNYLLGRDTTVETDDEDNKPVKFSKEEIEVIKEARKHSDLYTRLITDPVRSVELISRRLK
ncbi:MAG: helix-turn-helix transcriptional regulator [Bacilli bacterium]